MEPAVTEVREQIRVLAVRLEAAGVRLATAHAGDGTPADLFNGPYAVVAAYTRGAKGLSGDNCVVAQANTNFEWTDDLGRLVALLLANWRVLADGAAPGEG